jgi:oligopeptide transport system ATP-binding protein
VQNDRPSGEVPQPLLSVRDLKTYFRTDEGLVKAVDGVSFDLGPGQTLGIVGESGSGKSVMSLSLLRLVPPPGFHPSGSVLFEGRSVLDLPDSELRRLRGNRIAMIFQDPMTSLNPFLTIERQLTEVLELHQRISRRQARGRAIELLQRVGIPEAPRRIHGYPHELSGGMRQRVMIAMALSCEPALLVADEPTTALDVTTQAQILDLVRELQQDFATALLLITHDLGVVAGMTDRTLVMYAGHVVEAAPTDRLFSEPSHPYTQGLLASVPRLDAEGGEQLSPIAGLPPDLSDLPSGCPFHPRCARAVERCRQQQPPRRDISKGHWATCFRLQESEP